MVNFSRKHGSCYTSITMLSSECPAQLEWHSLDRWTVIVFFLQVSRSKQCTNFSLCLVLLILMLHPVLSGHCLLEWFDFDVLMEIQWADIVPFCPCWFCSLSSFGVCRLDLFWIKPSQNTYFLNAPYVPKGNVRV